MTAAQLSRLHIAAAFGAAVLLAGPASGSEGLVASSAPTVQTTAATTSTQIPRLAPSPKISTRTARTHAVRRIAPFAAPPRRYAYERPAACADFWCSPLAVLMLGIGF
ncbi:hypothetical protein [Nitrobacter winogradskyi]|uniref:Uncharacterized protein n=2 Tax=Nitrobacter winogradskyi TaxID=913 RepID=A0ACC6AJ37_NITWI|nr:hypothetical protein [Nitrobacter winogradskyi]MCP1999763.1 hypothetical protein [Nitrobacter winogradskyi]GEC15866.1 hypothetical protein NWI01_17580 [Nitrobacter winogradskyi]